MWVAIVIAVIALLMVAFMPKPNVENARASKLGDFQVPRSKYGDPLPLVWGTVRQKSPITLWFGDLNPVPIKKKVPSGPFSSKRVTTGYKYYIGIDCALALGPNVVLKRFWAGTKLVWEGNLTSGDVYIDKEDLFGGEERQGGLKGTFTFYDGRIDPIRDPYLASVVSPNVPAYNGISRVLFKSFYIGTTSNLEMFSFEISRITRGLHATYSVMPNGLDVNPLEICYDVITSKRGCFGNQPTVLNLASFIACAKTLYDEGIGMSMSAQSAITGKDVLEEVMRQCDGLLYQDPSTSEICAKLIREDYDPATLLVLDESNVTDLKNFSKTTWANTLNQCRVTFKDRAANYDDSVAIAQDFANINYQQRVKSTEIASPGCMDSTVANKLASRQLSLLSVPLYKCDIVTNRIAQDLRPGSVFKLNWSPFGLSNMLMRVSKIDFGELNDGRIKISCVQDRFATATPLFLPPDVSDWTPPNQTALPLSNPVIYEVPFFELSPDFSNAELVAKLGRGYLAVAAEKPSSTHLSFDILTKTSTETVYQQTGNSEFSFVSTIIDAIPQTGANVVCKLATPILNILAGDRLYIDSEILRVESVDTGANTLTLSRGCIDTQPQVHAAGSKIYVYSGLANASEREFSTGVTINLKFLTKTASDKLKENVATAYNATLSNRLSRPYPPCDVKLNSQYFPSTLPVPNGLTVSWQHKNRLTQTAQAPSFTNSVPSAETGVEYVLNIFDNNNVKLVDVTLPINTTSYNWNVPKRFDGTITTVLDLKMNGANNGLVFTDSSPNAFPVQSSGVLTKTDASVVGGSHACFDVSLLKTVNEVAKLDIYSQDHCTEFRIKTAKSSQLINHNDTFAINVSHERTGSENISTGYVIVTMIRDNEITIQATGTIYNGSGGATSKTVTYHATGLTADTYYDVAVQCIKTGETTIGGTTFTNGEIQIYFAGTKQVADVVHIKSWGYPCSLRLSSYVDLPSPSTVVVNALRITKILGGRYSGSSYTPAPFPVGSSNDSMWASVVFLSQMTGAENAHVFTDVSASAAALVATEAVSTKADASANGGSSANFFYPMLGVASQPVFNLRNKSFIISGRANGVGQIFKITDSITLTMDQYNLTVDNIFDSTPLPDRQSVAVFHGYGSTLPFPKYFAYKVMRNAVTGKTQVWIDDLVAEGTFNPASSASNAVLIGGFDRNIINLNKSYMNGFKIETVPADAPLVPDVVNPVRVELSSKREGLSNHQTLSTKVTLT